MKLEDLYSILKEVLPNKAFYGTNAYDSTDNASMPFIVYQEVTKRPSLFSDNKPDIYKSSVQITLVTKAKDTKLEKKLEQKLLGKGLAFSLLSESHNAEQSLNRTYEIYMEEILNAK